MPKKIKNAQIAVFFDVRNIFQYKINVGVQFRRFPTTALSQRHVIVLVFFFSLFLDTF